jgi:putative endonuclease
LDMENFIVYILHSSNHDQFYIGQTSNLERRLEEHNHSESHAYTSRYRPWTLYASIALESRASSVQVEKYLKKKPKDFIKRLAVDSGLVKYIIERYKKN